MDFYWSFRKLLVSVAFKCLPKDVEVLQDKVVRENLDQNFKFFVLEVAQPARARKINIEN
jgi:hypothetical protein